MAARMPMMRITTRSSMSVKPFSSLCRRWESFLSMSRVLLEQLVHCTSRLGDFNGGNPAGRLARAQPAGVPGGAAQLEPVGLAPPPRDGFALVTVTLASA